MAAIDFSAASRSGIVARALVLPAALLLLWVLLDALGALKGGIVVSPSQVFGTAYEGFADGSLPGAALATQLRALTGWAIGLETIDTGTGTDVGLDAGGATQGEFGRDAAADVGERGLRLGRAGTQGQGRLRKPGAGDVGPEREPIAHRQESPRQSGRRAGSEAQ